MPSLFQRAMTRRNALRGLLLVPALLCRPAAAQTPRVISIALQNGRASGPDLSAPARGAPVLRLIQGEAAELRIASDRAMALHLHGYGIETRAGPDAPAVIAFTARAAGRFPVETHGADGRHAAVFYVEVHPR